MSALRSIAFLAFQLAVTPFYAAAMLLCHRSLAPEAPRYRGAVTRSANQWSHLCLGNLDRLPLQDIAGHHVGHVNFRQFGNRRIHRQQQRIQFFTRRTAISLAAFKQ